MTVLTDLMTDGQTHLKRCEDVPKKTLVRNIIHYPFCFVCESITERRMDGETADGWTAGWTDGWSDLTIIVMHREFSL